MNTVTIKAIGKPASGKTILLNSIKGWLKEQEFNYIEKEDEHELEIFMDDFIQKLNKNK